LRDFVYGLGCDTIFANFLNKFTFKLIIIRNIAVSKQMNLELVKLNNFSDKQASVYSLLDKKTNTTLFEKFIAENINSFKSEIIDIIQRLNTIGKKVGAREQFFKTNEGKPGDLVCALYDNPKSNLR